MDCLRRVRGSQPESQGNGWLSLSRRYSGRRGRAGLSPSSEDPGGPPPCPPGPPDPPAPPGPHPLRPPAPPRLPPGPPPAPPPGPPRMRWISSANFVSSLRSSFPSPSASKLMACSINRSADGGPPGPPPPGPPRPSREPPGPPGPPRSGGPSGRSGGCATETVVSTSMITAAAAIHPISGVYLITGSFGQKE